MLYFSLLLTSLICSGLLELAPTAWLPVVQLVPAISWFFYGTGRARGETRDPGGSDNNAELDPDMQGSWGWNLAAKQKEAGLKPPC